MVTGFFSTQAEGYDIAEANNQYQAGKVIYDGDPKLSTDQLIEIYGEELRQLEQEQLVHV